MISCVTGRRPLLAGLRKHTIITIIIWIHERFLSREVELLSRGDRTRTCNLTVPDRPRYQIALHPGAE